MDSSVEHRPRCPSTIQDSTHCQFHQHRRHHLRHHHHHFRASPNCPFHSYMLHYFKSHHHSPTCPLFAALPPQSQYSGSFISVPFPNPFNLQLSQSKDSGFDNSPGVMLEENEEQQLEEEEEEDEEDPVFVLTDEWMEFFAKSEAKRRLAKKQARKKGKNVTEQ